MSYIKIDASGVVSLRGEVVKSLHKTRGRRFDPGLLLKPPSG